MLEVKNVSKKFKSNEFFSLQNVSFSIKPGEIVGLIGKNGAGKTTLMKMIAKTIKPTSGTITYQGKDIFSGDNLLHNVGLMIEAVYYSHLSAYRNLEFYLQIHNQKQYHENIEKVLDLVGLLEKKDQKPSGFSFGMKQRLGLALCLVTNPEFLILDEPFVGLDPNGVEMLIKTLKKWAEERNTTILISSHQLNELEELAERYLFIENGRLKDDFIQSRENITIIQLSKPVNSFDSIKKKYSGQITLIGDGDYLEVNLKGESFNSLLVDLTKENQIVAITTKENTIQKYFKEENDHD